ncbi:Protein O-linked-mannose beta-1,4-N-acetylglucosaminyltransferase 2 [Gonapodya sp. JEL0774]|nr:Protein O-linked-mannose beta-1,4-N-acetylglucosaminyltransferase 2 [Gonapodya sp. JEL0774]
MAYITYSFARTAPFSMTLLGGMGLSGWPLELGLVVHLFDFWQTAQKQPVLFMSLLWDNLFRTIYAGVAGWYTLMDYKVFFPNRHRIVLVDPTKPRKFLSILQLVAPEPLVWIDDPQERNSLYRTAVVGLSKDSHVAEIHVERAEDWRFGLRREAFKSFCGTLKEKVLSAPSLSQSGYSVNEGMDSMSPSLESQDRLPQLLLLHRNVGTRAILNEKSLIQRLQQYPVRLKVKTFENLNHRQQMVQINSTDILVATHGAGLVHVLFLRQGSKVVEIFPYGFRKTIFQNLCRIMGLTYMYYQNTRLEDSRFNLKYVESHRFTDMPIDEILGRPIDWNNMDSKNLWRNQDTRISLTELDRIMDILFRQMRSQTGDDRYLMMMPWEQFNNQVTGFKSACAVATMTDRTLVLPHLGYRFKYTPPPGTNTTNSTGSPQSYYYNPLDFVWHAFDRYFDSRTLSIRLPCRYVTMENFISLNAERSIGDVHYHSLGNDTSREQLVEYYKDVVAMPFDDVVEDHNTYYHLTMQQIVALHGSDHSRVLALGSMFWYYNFGIKPEYPLTKMYPYLGVHDGGRSADDGLYRRITEALEYRDDLVKFADRGLEGIRRGKNQFEGSRISGLIEPTPASMRLVCVHARRGDYAAKCRSLAELRTNEKTNLVESCWQNEALISKKVNEEFPAGLFPAVYVATDQYGDGHGARRFRRVLEEHLTRNEHLRQQRESVGFMVASDQRHRTVLFHENILAGFTASEVAALDPNERSIIDQLICAKSEGFIGNLHSSWSRRVVEMRELAGRAWTVF